MRTFLTPSGGKWTASLQWISAGASAAVHPFTGEVLRFESGEGVLFELSVWPDDWEQFSDAQLLELLRRAATEMRELRSERRADPRTDMTEQAG